MIHLKRRFLLDNDGSNIFHNMTPDIKRDIAEAIEECSDKVTTYLLCSGAGSYYFPTQVGIVDSRVKGLLKAHSEGKDPFGMFLDALNKSKMETFITFRMNDVHNPDDADQWNTPKIRKEHPDCIVDIEAVKSGKADWMCYCLDYSRPEVRKYITDIIRELTELYEFDGLQLDWMRFPRHLSGSPYEVWEKRHFITDFIGDVREILKKVNAELAVRIPTNMAGCRYLGMDVGEWVKQGLVDFIVPSPFLTTDFCIPISDFRKIMGDHPVPVYPAFDFGHGSQIHCPESLRATASSLYDCGAYGIYIFNFPCWQEYIASRPYHWLDLMHDPELACKKPLLFSVSHSRHRVHNIDLPGQLPMKIQPNQSIALALHIPKTALPAKRAMILVHSGGDIALKINGEATDELPASRRRSEIFVEYIDHDSEHRPTKADCRVFRPNAKSLKAAENVIDIHNKAGTELQIGRINLGLW